MFLPPEASRISLCVNGMSSLRFPRISAELLGQRMTNDIAGPYKCAMNYEFHKSIILSLPCKCANGSRVTSPRDCRVRFFFSICLIACVRIGGSYE